MSVGVVPVIIPSYEPDERLIELLEKLKAAQIGPVIIVNDGSSEQFLHFFDEAKDKYEVTLLNHEVNKGKGRALKTAFEYCLNNLENLCGCVTADSDGQHTPEAIKECIEKVINEPDKLILGVRDFSAANVPAKSQYGNNLTKKVFKALYKVYISDTQTGLRGISKEFMKILLDVPGDRFEYETRMLIKAVEEHIDILEFPIETVYDSKENHSTHFRPIVDSVKIYSIFVSSFLKFIVSSLSSSVVDIIMFQIACILLKNGQATFLKGVGYVAIATVIARVISATYNYLVNYFFVFKSNKSHGASVVKYILLAIIQMSVSALLVSALVGLTNVSPELIIKLPVDICLFFISYKIQKKYVY